ncbi:hypothetical protein EfmAA610_25380 [Enterococcus faecium]|nr:hypothetical protein EfmAA610_25380 [Enterococcus faecium]
MLEDIAILTGGTVITDDLGLELKDATIENLGNASKVVVDKSYLKDMAAPVLIDRFNVTDSVVENHLTFPSKEKTVSSSDKSTCLGASFFSLPRR